MAQIATHDVIVHDENLGIDRKVFAGQPVPPDLVEAYEKAGGGTEELTEQAEQRIRGFDAGEQVIASSDVIVHDDVLGIDRKLIAGQPVPPDLVDAYNAVGGETVVESPGEVAAADAAVASSDVVSTDYESQSVEDLQAEADLRGLTVTGTGKSGHVLKSDLVAALQADDTK